MDTHPLRIVVFGMEYFIALDVQRVIGENFGWDVQILPPSKTWHKTLATTDFDLIVTSLSTVEEDNLVRVRDVMQLRRGLVFTTTITVEPERSGAQGWPVVDLPFAEEALVEAIMSAAERLRLPSG
ncbi:hypothetical protein M8R20_02415 [Pseudomonas sp. R2.Fl]|nr:hypothetical protein [Pseudomonas sp. R2.Fl]